MAKTPKNAKNAPASVPAPVEKKAKEKKLPRREQIHGTVTLPNGHAFEVRGTFLETVSRALNANAGDQRKTFEASTAWIDSMLTAEDLAETLIPYAAQLGHKGISVDGFRKDAIAFIRSHGTPRMSRRFARFHAFRRVQDGVSVPSNTWQNTFGDAATLPTEKAERAESVEAAKKAQAGFDAVALKVYGRDLRKVEKAKKAEPAPEPVKTDKTDKRENKLRDAVKKVRARKPKTESAAA